MRLGTSANTPDPSRPTTTGAQRTWVEAGSNAQCDAGSGEVYRSQSPGKVSDIAACKKSCEDDPKCKSITFFNSGWCSHFSTECTKTKTTNKAIAMRLGGVISSTTTKVQATTAAKHTWAEVGSDAQCNAGAGEVYQRQSSDKVADIEACKKSCEDDAKCRSITFFWRTKWCSHFSTECTKTKSANKAIAMRLTSASGSTSTPDPSARSKWVQMGTKAACDTSAGEVYLTSSPGKLTNLEKCKQSCQSNSGCKSITYFNSGWCSHFSTPCNAITTMNSAFAAWKLI